MPDIFLSYSRVDQAIALRFRDAFAAQGLDVWWDVALRSGEAYDEVTETALREAKAVVVLWSARSVGSRWVRSEATLADAARTLVPVMIEPCSRPVMFELVQTADLSDWKGNIADRAWQGLLADVRRIVSGERDQPTPVQIAAGAAFKLPDKPSIAVLPFTDMAGSAAQDYFADGIVEEISTALSAFQTLFVIAGSSSLTFRDPERDPAKICRELGVRYLLEGSVRKSGSRVRITVKLVDGIAGEQIWADKFEDSLDDVFELQDRVARAVAGVIDSSIDTAEVKRALARPTSSPDANELYWRANALFRRWDPVSLKEAIGLTERVLEMEPKNAWAAALAGFCHASMFANQWSDDPMGSRTSALACYEQAMRWGGDDARVLGYAGATVTSVGGDLEVATRLIDRTLEITPGSATSLFWGSWNDAIIGNSQRGLERSEGSLRLNPRAVARPMIITAMGICLLQLRRFEEAASVLADAFQQVPNFPATQAGLTASLALCGRAAEAKVAAARLKATGGSWGVLAMMRNPDHLELLRAGIELAGGSEA